MSLKRTSTKRRGYSEILSSTPKDEKIVVNTSKSLSLSEINSGSSSSDNAVPRKPSVIARSLKRECLPKKKVSKEGTKKSEILPLRRKRSKNEEGRSIGSSWVTVYQDEVRTSSRFWNKTPSNICPSGSPEQTRDSKFDDALSLNYSSLHGIVEDANRSDLRKIDEDFTEEPLPLPSIPPPTSDIYDDFEEFDPSKVTRTYPLPKTNRRLSPMVKDPLPGKWPFKVRWPVATANALWEEYVEENREAFSRDFPHIVNGLRRQESGISSDSDDKEDIVESNDPYDMDDSESQAGAEDVRGENGELLPFRTFVDQRRRNLAGTRRLDCIRVRINIRPKPKQKKKASRRRKRRFNTHTIWDEDTSEDSNSAKNAEIQQSISVNKLSILGEPRAFSPMSNDSYKFLDRARTTANFENPSGRSDVELGSSQETLIYRLPKARGRRKRPVQLDTESDEYDDDKENRNNVQLQDSDDPHDLIRQSTKSSEVNEGLPFARSASRTLGESSDNTQPERKKPRITFLTKYNVPFVKTGDMWQTAL